MHSTAHMRVAPLAMVASLGITASASGDLIRYTFTGELYQAYGTSGPFNGAEVGDTVEFVITVDTTVTPGASGGVERLWYLGQQNPFVGYDVTIHRASGPAITADVLGANSSATIRNLSGDDRLLMNTFPAGFAASLQLFAFTSDLLSSTDWPTSLDLSTIAPNGTKGMYLFETSNYDWSYSAEASSVTVELVTIPLPTGVAMSITGLALLAVRRNRL